MRITGFAVHQTAKVVSLVYFCISLVLIPIFLILAFGHPGPADWFVLLAPVAYGVIGYLGTAVACFVYNLVAPRVGGIEFSVSESQIEPGSLSGDIEPAP